MSTTAALSGALRNARLALIGAAIDADSDPGELWLYSGVRPATGAAPAGALQCVIVLAKPCASVADQVLTFEVDDIEGQRVADAVIVWGRWVSGAGVFVMDADAGMPGAGAAITISNTAGYTGSFVRLLAGAVAE